MLTIFWRSLLLFCFTISAFAKMSYVSKTQTLNEGAYQLNLNSVYFAPTTHSDSNGTYVSFDEGESYQRADLNFLGSYGFTNNFEFTVGLKGRYIISTEVINNEDNVFTKSGLESALLQFKYSFPFEDGFQYSFEFNYAKAMYENEEYNILEDRQTVVLGEGGTSISAGLGFTWFTASQNYFSARFLYQNPAPTLSSEIFSELEFAICWPSFTMLAGVENIYSLNQDPYAKDPTSKPQISNGSTYEYNSINRSWVAPYAGFSFATSDTGRVELKAKSKVSGVSTDLGSEVAISFVKRTFGTQNAFAAKDSAFKEYKYEGVVSKITKDRRAVVIDIGLQKGMEKGAKVDFYHFDYLGGNQLIATGYAVKVGLSKSIVKLTKRFSKIRVQEGTVARSGLIAD